MTTIKLLTFEGHRLGVAHTDLQLEDLTKAITVTDGGRLRVFLRVAHSKSYREFQQLTLSESQVLYDRKPTKK